MATFTTSTGFPGSIPDAWFKKQLLKFGELNMQYRRFARKEEAPAYGKVWKANRYKRIELPMSALSEGVTPSDTNMELEQISLTATQYGIVVTLTDLVQLQMDHPVLQKGVEMVRDAMERLDNELICESLIAGTNVVYSQVATASVTARSGLAAGDILGSETIKRVVNALEFPTDAQWGSAPRFESGNYVCILHRKHELDLLADSTWKDMAIRLDAESLKKGMINRWLGVEFYTTNFGPKFENLGTANAQAANTAAIAAANVAGTGGFAASTAYDFTWTRRHKHRRFEEGISGVITVSTGAGDDGFNFSPPTNTAYVYTLYVGSSANTRYKSTEATNVPATTLVPIILRPTSGDVAPVAPAASVKVYCSFVFGKDAYAVVDLQNMEAGVSPDVRSDSDPLKQRRKIAAKFMEGSIILADNNLVRIEASSAF